MTNLESVPIVSLSFLNFLATFLGTSKTTMPFLEAEGLIFLSSKSLSQLKSEVAMYSSLPK